MPLNLIRSGLKDETGAVAVTYALALTGLVAMVGIGYDVSQVLTLDSELQNAADQAALAAVTQLDRQSGAIDRAKNAANSLIANNTLLAKDAGVVTIKEAGFAFYATRADAEAGVNPTTDNARARFAKVEVNGRSAQYALTPIGSAVASWVSPTLSAAAVAGIGSAICKVPPMKICAPSNDLSFSQDYVGKGLLLDTTSNSGLQLQFLGDASNTPSIRKALSADSPTGDCLDEENLAEGSQAGSAVAAALNTRFDIYDAGGNSQNACPAGVTCSPALNSSKDLIRKTNSGGSCLLSQNGTPAGSWFWPELSTYGFDASGTVFPLSDVKFMGHPRDDCHAKGGANGCGGATGVGDGIWNVDYYFRSNYGLDWTTLGISIPAGKTIPRRYDVYKWELARWASNPSDKTRTVGGDTAYRGPVCNTASTPISGTDRRVFPIAVVDCTSKATSQVVKKWVNVFLVEPSLNRGSAPPPNPPKNGPKKNYYRSTAAEVYVEVVSIARPGNDDGGNANVIRRDKPYLVK